MAGQDACLSLKEARAQQERIEYCPEGHQGPKNSGGQVELLKKKKHQG